MKLSIWGEIIRLVFLKFGALLLNLKCDSSYGCLCIVLWTSERMNASGWPYHAHCYFCYQVLWSDAHMFLGCLFPKSVWQLFGNSYPQIVSIASKSNYIFLVVEIAKKVPVIKMHSFRQVCALIGMCESPEPMCLGRGCWDFPLGARWSTGLGFRGLIAQAA